MSISPPIIQMIHASDAPQHTEEMKTILQRLKEEKRIAYFVPVDITRDMGNLSFKNGGHQNIIVLPTNAIERVRTEI